ncbi:S41 family peptidase [Roseimarinus sediminis]|jgi:carboxyl-terminal processing protease|uniref:S41 family peptidase n=1 Tax=Roseimarinus sediminis TaxID=1610899 RepID=UPI003D1AF0F6
MRRRKLIFGISALLLGGFLLSSLTNVDNKNFEIAKNLDIYYSLFRELNTFYVDEIDPSKLVKESIDEMLSELDPYTTFIPESDIEDYRFMTTGEYGGIGALIAKHDDQIVVSEPYEGYPAQKSGLMAGDVFLEVAGEKVDKMDTEDVSNLLKGAAGQAVKIKVSRLGEKKPLEFSIVREKISIDPVSYSGMLDQQTGYIRLTNFTKDAAEKVKKALLELKDQGAQQLVLDLRGNPGGLLMESVNMVNLFIDKDQEVVSTKGKVSQWDKSYATTGTPVDLDIPLAVLVNSGSASASEIVSGTIQDLDRGVVIGSRTFGKGLVQTTRDLSYNAKLKVTTAKYYIPSGRCIQALDYSHRNEDGSVGHVPDSLISEFQTLNGRKVYDGGGIIPDIEIENEMLSNLSIQLIRQFKIFDYATRYRIENPVIADAAVFEINDEIYNDFINYVESSDFTYTSETQKMLEQLKEMAGEEKYLDMASDEFSALASKLELDLDRDLKKFREEIAMILKNELVSRYYYQRGSAIAGVNDDKTIAKALSVLNDQAQYEQLLSPLAQQ